MQAEQNDVAEFVLPAMPEDAAAAWAGVLLDLMEKLSRQKAASDGKEQEDERCLCC